MGSTGGLSTSNVHYLWSILHLGFFFSHFDLFFQTLPDNSINKRPQILLNSKYLININTHQNSNVNLIKPLQPLLLRILQQERTLLTFSKDHQTFSTKSKNICIQKKKIIL